MALKDKKPDSQGLAIAGLLLNIFIFPGVGSLIGGKQKTGLSQVILAAISLPLMLILVGFITMLVAWIWGLITGIQMVQEG